MVKKIITIEVINFYGFLSISWPASYFFWVVPQFLFFWSSFLSTLSVIAPLSICLSIVYSGLYAIFLTTDIFYLFPPTYSLLYSLTCLSLFLFTTAFSCFLLSISLNFITTFIYRWLHFRELSFPASASEEQVQVLKLSSWYFRRWLPNLLFFYHFPWEAIPANLFSFSIFAKTLAFPYYFW